MEQPTPTDWPTTPWTLTAVESYVLQHGPSASGTEAFKIGLRELVVRGALRIVDIEESGLPWQRKRVTVLTPGARPRPPSEQSLASLWLLYSGIPLRAFPDGVMGVPMTDYVKQATRRYQSNLRGYVAEEVMPALIDRHLYAREEYRILWIFPATRLVLTPAGQTAQEDLARRLALGQEQFGGWVNHDPGRALAFMGLAGASVLLMSDQYPDFQRLQRQFPPPVTTSDTSGYAWTGDSDSTRRPGPVDVGEPIDEAGGGLNLGGLNLGGLNLDSLNLGNLDLSSFSFDIDFSALDSIGSAFESIDTAVESNTSGDSGSDSGGSDSGGDGGGGDGGGE